MIIEICVNCNNYEMQRSCKAFKKIPLEIWEGDNDHSKPLPSQKNDIVFEPLDNAQQ